MTSVVKALTAPASAPESTRNCTAAVSPCRAESSWGELSANALVPTRTKSRKVSTIGPSTGERVSTAFVMLSMIPEIFEMPSSEVREEMTSPKAPDSADDRAVKDGISFGNASPSSRKTGARSLANCILTAFLSAMKPGCASFAASAMPSHPSAITPSGTAIDVSSAGSAASVEPSSTASGTARASAAAMAAIPPPPPMLPPMLPSPPAPFARPPMADESTPSGTSIFCAFASACSSATSLRRSAFDDAAASGSSGTSIAIVEMVDWISATFVLTSRRSRSPSAVSGTSASIWRMAAATSRCICERKPSDRSPDAVTLAVFDAASVAVFACRANPESSSSVRTSRRSCLETRARYFLRAGWNLLESGRTSTPTRSTILAPGPSAIRSRPLRPHRAANGPLLGLAAGRRVLRRPLALRGVHPRVQSPCVRGDLLRV